MRIETAGMAYLREQLRRKGYSNKEIDTFKQCLIDLQREGFSLERVEKNEAS